MKLTDKPTVILRHCPIYDVEKIQEIVSAGMKELGFRPNGKTLVKPNIVISGEMFPHAYTRPEFAEGVLRAIQAQDTTEMSELTLGERCGITVPTRTAMQQAGYPEMIRRVGNVKTSYFEEEEQVQIPLSHPKRLRDYVFTPKPVAECDTFVNLPKFKAHPWTTVTFSMKNYIGIQDDRHRLIDHDHKLNQKIVDLQHILQPQFIAIDGIIAGEGRMLTPTPFDLGLIIMGNSQMAIDSIASQIIGLHPHEVDHIRMAEEQGFGSTRLEDITLKGDVTLQEAKQRAQGFQVGLIRVEKYFEGTNISAYAGPPPESEEGDYCWGGCPGALEEAIEILRQFDEKCDEKFPKIHIIFGAYKGAIDAQPGEKVFFIGDCATWSGTLHGQPVEIPNLYVKRSEKDPHHAKHEDIYKKMLKTTTKMAFTKERDYVRLRGCPVSVAEQVLALVSASEVENPYFSPSEIIRFNRGYLGWKGRATLNRVMGKRYQKNKPFKERGKAAPEL